MINLIALESLVMGKKHCQALTLAAAGGVLALSACGGSSSDEQGSESATSAGTLNYHGGTFEVTTIDPAKWYVIPLAYDYLIYRAPDGALEPQLAEEWRYVDDENRVFEMTLRPDVIFTDGEPLNAQAVKRNIEYRLNPQTGSGHAAQLGSVSEVEVVDDLTVRIHLEESNPLMPEIFSKGPGAMISPAAIADPQKLATDTFGVGRYELDKESTIQGERYTFVPNEKYWNPESIYWDEVVVHYLPEESAALASLQSGQLDAATVNFGSVEAGTDAGFAATGPGKPIVLGLSLVDREGEVVPALEDQRVRQALNFAIDREKIASALIGESGEATDQLSAPGQTGWNEEGIYSYDPERARELLAEAGWDEGFDLPVRVPRGGELERLAQAIGDELRDVGVNLQLDAVPPDQWDQSDDATNRDYGAVFLAWGIEPPFNMARIFWLPDAGNNTFDSTDEKLVELHEQLQTADEGQQDELNQEMIARVGELGWFLPVVVHGQSVLYDDEKVEVPWTEFVSSATEIVQEIRPAK